MSKRRKKKVKRKDQAEQSKKEQGSTQSKQADSPQADEEPDAPAKPDTKSSQTPQAVESKQASTEEVSKPSDDSVDTKASQPAAKTEKALAQPPAKEEEKALPRPMDSLFEKKGVSIEISPPPAVEHSEGRLRLHVPTVRMGPIVLRFSEMVYVRTVVILASIALVLYLLYYLKSVVSPILFALSLAYLINPLVDRLESWGASRQVAISLLVIVVTLVFIFFVLLALPAIAHSLDQLTTLAAKLPEQLARLKVWFQKTFDMAFPDTWHDMIVRWGKYLKEYAPKAIKPATQILKTVYLSGVNLLLALFNLILVPLFTFYFLKDYKTVKENLTESVPPRMRERTMGMLKEMDRMVSGFIRGQITVSMIVGSMYFGLLSLIGVSLVPILAFIGAFLNIVPYLGFLTIFVITLIVTLIDYGFAWQFWAVFFGMGGVHMIDVFFITPRVVGEKVGLSELVVIIAILAGGRLFGLIGVFFAVPIAAVTKVFLKELLVHYKESSFYQNA